MKDWRLEISPNIYYENDTDELLNSIARNFIELIIACQDKQGFFSCILGGGRTPIKLNEKIVEHAKDAKVDWTRVFIFFSDERCVPSNHNLSNYKMILETFGIPLGIPKENLFRMKGEKAPEIAATEYEDMILNFFIKHNIETFDLAILGLGEDCHTASLFPRENSLYEDRCLVVPGGKGKEGLNRVTLTYSIINKSNNIWFLITGEEKKEALKSLIHGEYDIYTYPAQGVCTKTGNIIYFTDIQM